MPRQYSQTVRSGDYNKLLTFQIRTELGRDSTGGLIEDWADDFTVWGSFEPIKSDLLHADVGDKRFAESVALFRIRYPLELDKVPDAARHRIVFVSDPVSSPLGLSIWDMFPPLQVDGRFRELHIKGRQYR